MPDTIPQFATRALGRRRVLASGLCFAQGIVSNAHAQGLLRQPVRMVVPFSAGGAVDFVARLMGHALTARIGQPIVVENRTGASGAIGAQFVARAPADGHTLLMTPITSFAMLAGMPGNTLGVDLVRDFAPVGTIGSVPVVVAASHRLQVDSLAGLVALARNRPEALSYASAGNGSTEHLAAEMFAMQAGMRLLHVPYRGGAPALADVLAGQVDLMFATLPNVMQNGSGMKVLAIATESRSPVMPEVPTAAEVGFPGFTVSSIYGLLAPAGTPQPVLAWLGRELQATAAQPDIRERLMQQGVTPDPRPSDITEQQLRSEIARWAQVVRSANIQLN